MSFNKKTRQIVFDKTNGKCAYCGEELKKGWQVDHLFPQVMAHMIHSSVTRKEYKINFNNIDDIENLLPSCRRCNNYKSFSTLEQFRKKIADWERKAFDESVNFRNAKRFGLYETNTEPVVFYFETIKEKS